jgi:hypothetical protein
MVQNEAKAEEMIAMLHWAPTRRLVRCDVSYKKGDVVEEKDPNNRPEKCYRRRRRSLAATLPSV